MPFSPQGQVSVSQNRQFTILLKLTAFIFAIRERVMNRGFLHRYSMYNCTATKEVQPFKKNSKLRFLHVYSSFLPFHFFHFCSTIRVVNRTLSVFGILWTPA